MIRFEQVLAEGIAQCSYIFGDDAARVAAVVDPTPDVEVYLDIARRYGVSITHVFETHIHADFMSGARELVDRLGGQAKLCVSVEGGAKYGFEHQPVHDGDRFSFGALDMEARATPGHTPEHVAYFLYEEDRPVPWGVLSGDAFFVASIGRPDLLGAEETQELSEQLFHTVRDIFLRLDDGVILYPCHAAGSACGPDIGDRTASAIGYERRFNPYAGIDSFEAFSEALRRNAPPVPHHYPRLKTVNSDGPPVLRNLPRLPALTPAAFETAIAHEGAQILDTRDMLAFGAGHVPGALNIGARPELSVWAGWLLDPDRPVHLVLDDERDLPRVLTLLWRTGFVNFGGYLAGGVAAWREEGRKLGKTEQMPVHELRNAGLAVTPLDVRKPEEWEAGRLPGARHVFLGELRERLGELDPARAYATYCASGFRASIAASLLAANGFRNIRNVPGSWKAWKAAGYEIAKG